MKIAILLLLVLLLSPAYAHVDKTYSDIDPKALPAYNIYDPYDQQNHRITKYSYEEIVEMMQEVRFRRWNDMPKVCQSLQLMFGKTPPNCSQVNLPLFIPPVTARAYAEFYILPQPVVYTKPVFFVDPIYPPWSPAHHYFT